MTLKVAIDPGHGWGNRHPNVYDPGAQHLGKPPESYDEADIVHDYALELERQFYARDGVQTWLTRPTRKDSANVGARASRAEREKCDVFVSLHINDADSHTATGTETLYYRESARVLADCVQAGLVRVLGLRDRGVKFRDDLSVLHFSGPAILIEFGFINNPADLAIILDKEHRKKACAEIVSGVCGWWSSLP